MRAPLMAFLSLLLAGLAPSAMAGSRAGILAVDAVRGAIAARACPLAVERLKSGLKDAHPEVALLAGSMYENGICVRRDWQRAQDFYVQAHDAGERDAALRMAAGFADPLNGPDMAAALWWAAQTPGAYPDYCAVPAQDRTDPERFVAALQAWEPSRLAHCNYIVGLLSTMASETKYPGLAVQHGLGGAVTLRFLPGVPRIELQRGAVHEYELLGWVDADTLRDRKSRKMGDGFGAALSATANRALRRYPHPGGISHDTVITVPYQFSIEDAQPR